MRISIVIAFILVLFSLTAMSQSVRIGIATDFKKSAELDSIIEVLVSEIDRTVGASSSIAFEPSNIRYGITDLEAGLNAYNELEPSTDLFLLFGSVSTKGGLLKETFTKPTFGLAIVDPVLQNLPFENGTSGRDNFSYIWSNQDIFRELGEFRRLVEFKKLAILINPTSAQTINGTVGSQLLDSIQTTFGAEINLVPVLDDMVASIAAIPEGTDAVFISELNAKSPAEIQQLADELIEKRLPSFSSSQWHTQVGILSSLSEENDIVQAIRKLSIMIDEYLIGEPLKDMSVTLNFKETYTLNLQTAREIGLSPSFDVIFTANLIDEDGSDLPAYSLMEVLDRSLKENLDIKLVFKDLDLTDEDIRLARSAVLPELGFAASATESNPASANAFNPERQGTAQLSLSQIIYSEEAIAAVKIAQYVRAAQNYQTLSDILNVILDTYVAYFNVLGAKTDLSIQRENLENFTTNLEISKLKLNTGAASSSDVYRWESEVATARQAVIDAEVAVISAKLELNNILANTLEEEFDIDDVTIDGDLFETFHNDRISNMIQRPVDFKTLSDFMVKESVSANPNKLLLLENLKALERQKLQNKRLFYVPTVALQAQSGYVFYRGGVGSELTEGISDESWNVGLSLSYPIFSGNSRRATLSKSIIQVEQLEYSRTQLDQQLELFVRTNLLSALSASTNIEFSATAAQSALNNYDLVRDNYQQGSVSITQLIDAQQAAFSSQLANALSVYNFMIAKLQVEFSVGFFSMLTPEEDLVDFENRFEEYLLNNN